MTITAQTAATEAASCTLDIGGMTCASCVRRVERVLGKVEGVATAGVNLAAGAAPVTFDPQRVGLAELTAAVGKAGYTATPRREERSPSSEPARPEATGDDDALLQDLKRKWQVALTAG